MAPRQIFTPLSGSARSAQAKGIREAQGLAEEYGKQAASLRKEIDAKLMKARTLECEAWSATMWAGGPAQPSPRLGEALACGFVMLQIQCGSCHRMSRIDLRHVRRKPSVFLWTLEASLFCKECRDARGYRPRAHITGLQPDDPPPEANRKRASR